VAFASWSFLFFFLAEEVIGIADKSAWDNLHLDDASEVVVDEMLNGIDSNNDLAVTGSCVLQWACLPLAPFTIRICFMVQ
jgi:hypothetical protein